MEVYQHVAVFKLLHDGSIDKESVFVGTQIEGSVNDGIGITMICYHYVLIYTLWADREAAIIISVKFADVLHLDM